MEKENDKILVADDSILTFRIISEILRIVGSKVDLFYAEDGKKACQMALEIIPDLILMDVIMPEMNGIEAVKHLRADKRTSEIPIIVLSATESLDSAYEAGANDFISKPFHNHELLIKVRSALNLVQKIKEIRNQKAELEEKHKQVLQQRDKITQQRMELLADIRYSERIQKAILPTEDQMARAFPEHFILNLPRNIVSGDFYWLGELDGKQIFAVADCTGHGISGAFMTMAGTAFLNEILGKKNASHTSDILFQLRELIMKLLKQKGEEGETADGMDISIILVDKDRSTLQFSGANNPFYLVRDGELHIFKGDRMPIGIHLKFNQPFANQTIEIKSGDMIYMFSDGYADQFGGPRDKKFRYRPFQDLLLSIYKLPLIEQKEKLYRTMVDWKGANDQVDDILVIGLKV